MRMKLTPVSGDVGALLARGKQFQRQCHKAPTSSLTARGLCDRLAELVVGSRHRKLREVSDDVVRGTEEDSRVRRGEHAGIVVRVAGRDHTKRQAAAGIDAAAP